VPASTVVRLLARLDCGLCDEAAAVLARLGLRRPLTIERVEVGDDPRYILRVPVLRVGAEELDAAGLEDGAIARWLDQVSR